MIGIEWVGGGGVQSFLIILGLHENAPCKFFPSYAFSIIICLSSIRLNDLAIYYKLTLMLIKDYKTRAFIYSCLVLFQVGHDNKLYL